MGVEHAFLVNGLCQENISLPANFSEKLLSSGGCVVAVEVWSQVKEWGQVDAQVALLGWLRNEGFYCWKWINLA